MKWTLLLLGCCISLVICLIVLRPKAVTLTYVVPDNKTGVMKIVLDKKIGHGLEKTKEGYVLEFPDNGIVYLNSFDILYKWHRTLARYKSGQSLPCHSMSVGLSFWELGGVGGDSPVSYSLVGSYDEYERIVKAENANEVSERLGLWKN